jgi:hypothetical protein
MNWIGNIIVKALYGLAGLLAYFFASAQGWTPPAGTDSTTSQLWMTLLVPVFVGIAAQLKRWIAAGIRKASESP